MTLKKLQNGSDIRGVAIASHDRRANLGKAETFALSFGFAKWLSQKTGKDMQALKICIGRDSRISGKELLGYILQTFNHLGITSLDSSLSSTPAMFMSTVFDDTACDGAIMITASHLPQDRNGFKYFARDGGLNKSDIAKIISFGEEFLVADKINAISDYPNTPTQKSNLMQLYAKHLQKTIIEGVLDREDISVDNINAYSDLLSNLHIVVDAGNGAGGFFASAVLAPLGANIAGSQFLDADGTFPNHIPNPEDKEAMLSISSCVLANGADLGIIFDTDVDRSSAVDERGNFINRNSIVALASIIAKNSAYPPSLGSQKPVVVTDSITSTHLTDFIENALNLSHFRFKRGYKNVINKAIELNEAGCYAPLAIETSGHAAFKENYFLDDGAYLATKIIIEAAKLKTQGLSLSSLLSGLSSPREDAEIRIPITCADFSEYASAILLELHRWALENPSKCTLEEPNYEGVRINFKDTIATGWLLLRKSLHDPIMPLNIESDEAGGVAKIKEQILVFLSEYENLDLSVFN